jgi:ADP-heptose:LPS heptosyltransferase
MNADRFRKIDRWAGIPLCRIVSLVPGSRARLLDAGRVERILVIMLTEMGSLVLAEPMLRDLKRRYPVAALYALLFARNRELLELLDVIPPQNILAIDDGSVGRFLAGSLRAVRVLRRLGIDAVIDGELFARASCLLAYLCGARIRVGFHRHTQEGLYRGDFINRPVLYNPYQHFSQQLLTLAAAVDSETEPSGKRVVPDEPQAVTQIAFTGTEIAALRRQLAEDHPAIDLRKLVLLQPGGGLLPIRAWSVDNFVRVSAGLLEAGYDVAVIGPPEDREVARAIAGEVATAHCFDLTGFTRTVRELLQLLSMAQLLIANDGGPAQLSALVAIPAVILYGPETPVLYGSLNPRATRIHRPLSCYPCITAYNHRRTPCDGDTRCLKEISPDVVLAEALRLLRLSSGST